MPRAASPARLCPIRRPSPPIRACCSSAACVDFLQADLSGLPLRSPVAVELAQPNPMRQHASMVAFAELWCLASKSLRCCRFSFFVLAWGVAIVSTSATSPSVSLPSLSRSSDGHRAPQLAQLAGGPATRPRPHLHAATPSAPRPALTSPWPAASNLYSVSPYSASSPSWFLEFVVTRC
jgi:hypothetical protein|uniref:Uncharacterized protein n=1 Tax=Zea mays TaxID=4577 RepID=A0A804MF94_MAIZE